VSTEALGIFQPDLVLRSAIIAALKDIRENPWLIDYVFRSLSEDALTAGTYGEAEIAQAKKWLLNTDFPVFMATRLDESKLPCISIALMESAETEQTHGDIHYQPTEVVEGDSPNAGMVVTLESIAFRETYQIAAHVQGESFYLTYLHSLLVFILAGRYKQSLLEARGFERSTISSSQFLRNDNFGTENVYSRFINITGYVRQYWPKYISKKISNVFVTPVIVPPPGGGPVTPTPADSSELLITFGVEGSNGPGIDETGASQTSDDAWGVDSDAMDFIGR
jgi:hypothetical protein